MTNSKQRSIKTAREWFETFERFGYPIVYAATWIFGVFMLAAAVFDWHIAVYEIMQSNTRVAVFWFGFVIWVLAADGFRYRVHRAFGR